MNRRGLSWNRRVGWAIVWMWVAGCAHSGGGPRFWSRGDSGIDSRVVRELGSTDPVRRMRAIHTLVEQGGRASAGIERAVLLVDRIEDEDAAVAWMAMTGLEKLTGKRFHDSLDLSAEARRRVAERWRLYLAESREAPDLGGVMCSGAAGGDSRAGG